MTSVKKLSNSSGRRSRSPQNETRKKRRLKSLFLGGLLAWFTAQACADTPWQLRRDKDGIRIYTRAVEGSHYKAVKATMTIPGSLTALAALVRDSPACPRWQARCKEARGIKIVNPREMYVYQVNNLPWPIADRDVVAHVRWRQDPHTLAVYMTATSVSGMFPPQKGLVRVPEADTHWTFQPKGKGRVEVITETHVDPGGPIPAWFVNMMMVSLPYETMENMRRIIATGAYKNAKIGFIKEPVNETQKAD